jgi:hypothetical protein
MITHPLLFGESNESNAPQANEVIAQYKKEIYELSNFLLLKANYREISGDHIDHWIKELRDIIAGMQRLQDDPNPYTLFVSYESITWMIYQIITKLYLASEILVTRKQSLKSRFTFYQTFPECAILLSHLVEIFNNIYDHEKPFE